MRNSFEKVFSILEVVASGDGPVSLKEIAERTGHHPSTVSRILADLVETGYVRKESYREFSLDLGLVPLGQKALTHFPLARLAEPLVAEAAGRLGCQGALAGMHRERMVYLCRTGLASGPAPLAEDWGCPLHRSNCALVILAGRPDEEARKLLAASLAAGAGGKAPKARLDALMSQLASARRDGYSLLVEEGTWNAAFPLVYRGRTFAAALHGPGEPPGSPEKAVLEASLLARRIEEAACSAP